MKYIALNINADKYFSNKRRKEVHFKVAERNNPLGIMKSDSLISPKLNPIHAD